MLDLSLKAQSQLQHLKHLERTFNVESEQLKKMTETCRQDDFSTEADCIQVIFKRLKKEHNYMHIFFHKHLRRKYRCCSKIYNLVFSG